MTQDSFFRRMPKVELHCHLDGALRVGTVLDLARRASVKLPADNEQDLAPFVQVAPACRSLREFLDVFDLLYPLLRTSEAVERIAYELVEDSSRENIRHLEVRFAPLLQATPSFPLEEVVQAALRGLERGRKDFGTTSGILLCLFRSHSPAENRKAFEALRKAYDGRTVVGMDLAGDEARHPTMEFAEFFEQAKRHGIRATCHAGETVGTANLEAALELGVDRIGHGTHLMEGETLLKEVVRRRVPLEIGLTSNVRTKSVPDLASHPFVRFHKAGVRLSLNTDDRGIIGIDLTHEYEAALSLGLSQEELVALSLDAVDQLFLPEPDRASLRRRFEEEIVALKADEKKAAPTTTH